MMNVKIMAFDVWSLGIRLLSEKFQRNSSHIMQASMSIKGQKFATQHIYIHCFSPLFLFHFTSTIASILGYPDSLSCTFRSSSSRLFRCSRMALVTSSSMALRSRPWRFCTVQNSLQWKIIENLKESFDIVLPSRKLTYPTLGKGKSSTQKSLG